MNKSTRRTQQRKNSVSSAAATTIKRIRKGGNGSNSRRHEQVEEALRESEEKYRNLFEYAKDAIILADTETGQILDVNNAGCILLGLPKEKIIGKHQSEIHPPELAEKYKQLFQDHIQKGIVIDEDIIVQRADGTQVPIDISASVVKLADKTIIQGIFRNVSERLRMARALKESEERISKAFRSIPEAVSIAALKDGVFLEVNDSFLSLNGYSREEVIGHTGKELNIWVKPEDRYRIRQLMEKHGRFENEEFLLRRKSGDTRTVLLSADVINFNGQPCILTIGADITEQKRIEEALRQSEAKYSSLVERSNDGIIIIENGILKFINTKMAEMTGFTREEAVGRKFIDFSPPEEKKRLMEIHMKRMAGGDVPTDYETSIIASDGHNILTEINACLITYEGRPAVMAIIRDITERKQTEQALRYHANLVQSIPDAVVSCDMDFNIISWNIGAKEIYGWREEEVVGKNLINVLNPVSPNITFEDMNSSLKNNGFWKEEVTHERKDGRTVNILASTSIIKDKQGNLKGAVSIFKDITERKQMEEALVNEATRRRILIEQSRDGIVILDNNGKVYEANQRFAEMLGYSHDEVRQLHVFNWEFLYPSEQVVEMIRTVDEKGDHFETQHRRKDGTTFDVEISTNGAMFAGQKLIFCVCRDITERKRMEQAVKESEEKFSKAFHASPEAIAITTLKEGRYIDVNDSYVQRTGYSKEELIGKTTTDIQVWASEEDRAGMRELVEKQGKVNNAEFNFRMKSGEIRTWLLSLEPITIKGEECFIGVSLDITERKRMEQAVKESEEKFSKAFHSSPQQIIITRDRDDKTLEVNDSYAKVTGFTREESVGKTSRELGVWPKAEDNLRLQRILKDNGCLENEEFEFLNKSGEKYTALVCIEPLTIGGEKCWLSIVTDITERKKEENLQKAENRVLTLLSRGAELNEVLDAIILLCEQNDPSITGSYMFYNASKNWLTGGGPSLSEEYNAAMKAGIPAGPIAGSCGTAAYRKQRVIVPDIKNSPLFQPYPDGIDAAIRNGLLAVWSEPIISSNGDLLGTIANYSDHIGEPTAENIQVLEWSARIAAIAIEHKKMEKALKESEEKFSTAFHAMPEAVSISRLVDGTFIDVNASFCRDTGKTRDEIIGHTGDWVEPGQREQIIKMVREQGRAENIECEFKKKSGELHTVLISADMINIGGEPCMLSIGSDITERKKMENALRESEEKFSKAFHAMPEAVTISRLDDGKFIDVNETFCRDNGYTREEVIGRNGEELNLTIGPNYREEVIKLIEEQGCVKNMEFEIKNKSGEMQVVLFSADRVNIGGEPCLLSIRSNITERKKMENALKESEEKFSKAFHAMPEAVSISRMKDGVFIDVNTSFCRDNEYNREEVVGHTGKELVHWVDPIKRERIMDVLKEKGHIGNIECEFKKKSGEVHTVLFSADTINIKGELCMLSITSDITERKRMEQALRESEEKFSKAFHAIPETLSISTIKEGGFLDVNESFLKLNQLTREEVIGRTGAEIGFLKPEDERNKIRELLKKTNQFNNVEIEFKAKSGKMLTFLFSANTIDIGGEPCLLIIGNDITERKLAEKNLQRALLDLEQSSALIKATNKELESFSYSVSHDLRSPLRSIDGFSQALLEDYTVKLDEKGQDYLNRLRNASQKMGELIDGLLKLSRLTRSEMHHEKVDLTSLANEIATRLQETHTKRDVKFLISEDLTAKGDPQMLRVLLENLIGNAWKFTKNTRPARIEFGSITDDEKNTFFIKDNGAGFDMAFKDKLFGAFQRLHDAVEFPGTGIGLATVQRIINRHGGSIHAEGEVGKGATFYFTLN